MRPERRRAERSEVVREAARQWRRAGVISGATLEQIEAEYPDDRLRLAPIWRVTVFSGVLLAVLAAAVGFAVAVNLPESQLGAFCLILGIFSAAATEIQQRRFRFVSTGSDAATSFLALVFLLLAWGRWLDRGLSVAGGPTLTLVSFAAFVLFGLSAWRWGFALYGLVSASCLIIVAGRVLPVPRIGWAVAACVILSATVPFLDRSSLPPSHRDAIGAAMASALISLYAVFNPWSLEARWIEELSGRLPALPGLGSLAKWLSAAATTLFTLAVLVWGIRKRRRIALDLGAVFVVLSLVTLRHYVHLAPLWVILSAAGAAAVAAAAFLDRRLSRLPEGSSRGLTSQPLFANEQFLSGLSIAATVATLSPGAEPGLSPGPKKFEGGGGSFGGGGASADF